MNAVKFHGSIDDDGALCNKAATKKVISRYAPNAMASQSHSLRLSCVRSLEENSCAMREKLCNISRIRNACES